MRGERQPMGERESETSRRQARDGRLVGQQAAGEIGRGQEGRRAV